MLYRGAERYGYSLLNDIQPWGLLDDRGRTLMSVLYPPERNHYNTSTFTPLIQMN